MSLNLTSEQCIKRQKHNEKLSAVFIVLTGISAIVQIFEMSFRCMSISKTTVDFAFLFELFFNTISSHLYFIFAFLTALCLGTAKYYKTMASCSK